LEDKDIRIEIEDEAETKFKKDPEGMMGKLMGRLMKSGGLLEAAERQAELVKMLSDCPACKQKNGLVPVKLRCKSCGHIVDKIGE